MITSKTLTAAMTAVVLAGQAVAFASHASAYDRYRDFDGGPGYSRFDHGPRDFERRGYGYRNGVERGARGRDEPRPQQYVETRKKDKTARTIAIGLSAFMLGAILASEAQRR